jgi:hypothetical protein
LSLALGFQGIKQVMNHIESIDTGLAAKKSYNEIVRKVYLAYPTKAFVGDEERQYLIMNEISSFFEIPIMSIQIAGSAKTGRSFHKQRDFKPGDSDLDVAIIDPSLFQKYMEIVFKDTKGYTDRTGFQIRDGKSTTDEYIAYLTKGIFRADLMPSGSARNGWSKFFGLLSARHGDLFKSINAGIYMSQLFFENKQRSAIKNYIENKAV